MIRGAAGRQAQTHCVRGGTDCLSDEAEMPECMQSTDVTAAHERLCLNVSGAFVNHALTCNLHSLQTGLSEIWS